MTETCIFTLESDKIFIDNLDNIWITNGQVLLKMNEATTEFWTANYQSNNGIHVIREQETCNETLFENINLFESGTITGISGGENNSVWVTLTGGSNNTGQVLKYDGDWTIYTSSNSSIPSYSFYNVASDLNNQTWVLANNFSSTPNDYYYYGNLLTLDCESDIITNLTTKNEHLSIYPNPTQKILYVRSENITSNFKISVTDILGQNIHIDFMNSSLINLDGSINIEHLKKGIYLLNITHNGISEITRFTKY